MSDNHAELHDKVDAMTTKVYAVHYGYHYEGENFIGAYDDKHLAVEAANDCQYGDYVMVYEALINSTEIKLIYSADHDEGVIKVTQALE